jgi:hypothetical protein
MFGRSAAAAVSPRQSFFSPEVEGRVEVDQTSRRLAASIKSGERKRRGNRRDGIGVRKTKFRAGILSKAVILCELSTLAIWIVLHVGYLDCLMVALL